MVDLFHIRTDSDGWRGRATLPESDTVAVEDSSRPGYRVSERQLFRQLTTQRPHQAHWDVGARAWWQDISGARLATNSGARWSSRLLTFGNDLYDNLCRICAAIASPFCAPHRPCGRMGDLFPSRPSGAVAHGH